MTTIPFVNTKITELKTSLSGNLSEVLFNDDLTELIHCPVSIEGDFIIPDTVRTIGIEAFAGCKALTSILIPSSVKTIGCYAFADCRELKAIYMQSNMLIKLKSDSGIFQHVDKALCTLYVPVGSKRAYHQVEPWSEFENIVEKTEFDITHSHKFKLEKSKQVI